MLISFSWLGRHVNLEGLDPGALAEELTLSTAEVEGVEPFAPHLSEVTVGHVLERKSHPDADKLSVCTVDVGAGDPLQIVCGADNVDAGQNVAVATVGTVLPGLAGKLDGMAMRVPVPDGSIVDLVVQLSRETTVLEVNAAMRTAAAGPLAGIIEYSTEALVSSDIIGNPHSAIFDAPLTEVVAGNQLKVFAWYDNEWGYANRIVDLVRRLSKF